MADYIVVLRSKRGIGPYQPALFWWASFGSREAFKDWYGEDKKLRQEIVKEGVSEKQAKEMVESGASRLI